MPIQAKQLIATFEKGEQLATTNGNDANEAVSPDGLGSSNGPKLNREVSLEELAQPGTARRLLSEFESKVKLSGVAGDLPPKSPGLRTSNRLSTAIAEAPTEATATTNDVREATIETTTYDAADTSDNGTSAVGLVQVVSAPSSTTASYKLIYFPVRGRSAHIRYLCADNGLPLEIETVTDWPAFKSSTPLGQLPVFQDGNYKLAQSNAILRYLARKHDLYGSTDEERGHIDMINDQQEDIRSSYVRLIYGDYDTGKEAYIQNLPKLLAPLEKVLTENYGGTGFLVGDKISFADYTVFDLLDNISALSQDSLDILPNLKAYHSRIAARPKLAAFRETEEFKRLPRNGNGKE